MMQNLTRKISASQLPECRLFLFVDDDPDYAELLIEAVRTLEVESTCIKASSGREALKLLEEATPDFIFLDVQMPRMDGRETLQHIRRMSGLSDVRVCVFSSTLDEKSIAFFNALGATCFRKPTSFTSLRNTIKFLLQSHKQ